MTTERTAATVEAATPLADMLAAEQSFGTLRALFADLDPADAPRAVLIEDDATVLGRRRRIKGSSARKADLAIEVGTAAATTGTIGIMAGSFDPLTNAHLALARAALGAGGCEGVYLALSRHTVDKEGRVRPSDAERAILLRQVARREGGLGVLAFNRGLYADQAVAARALFPRAEEIRFVVGFDKARQIFDPRYYADRDAALRQLFAHVTLLVAPRADDGADDLAALLARLENAPFRDHVRALPLDPSWADDSATRVRAAAEAGDHAAIAALVPPETEAWLAAISSGALDRLRASVEPQS